MNTPQDRVIKKMIDNIVETNRPSFEKPLSASSSSAPITSSSQSAAPSMVPEDYALITRKLDYGFNNLRQENAELRKQLEELGGGLKLIRGDLENIRSMVGRGGGSGGHSAPAPQRHEQEHTPQPASQGHGAPQYRESAADAAYHQETGTQSHHEEPQARGTQKKDEPTIDISKVFYYGKK